MVAPAAPEDSDPLERQRPHRRVMAFAFGSFGLVVQPRPGTASDRAAREFVKGLQQKLRTGVTAVHEMELAAFARDRGDAAQALDGVGFGETIPVGAEGGDQARGQSGAGAGQARKDGRVGMSGKQRFNLLIVRGDGGQQGAQLTRQALHAQSVRDHDRGIVGQSSGGFDLGQPLVDQVRATAAVGIVEGAHGLGFGFL